MKKREAMGTQERHTQGESQVRMEAEVEVLSLQAKEHQVSPAKARSKEEERKNLPQELSKRPCMALVTT